MEMVALQTPSAPCSGSGAASSDSRRALRTEHDPQRSFPPRPPRPTLQASSDRLTDGRARRHELRRSPASTVSPASIEFLEGSVEPPVKPADSAQARATRLAGYIENRKPWLWDLCQRCVKSEEVEVDDVFAEAVLRACEHLKSSIEDEVSWDGWFFRVIHNLCVDDSRRADRETKLREGLLAVLETGDGFPPGVDGDQRSPEWRAIERQKALRLTAQAAALPERLSDAIALRAMHGLSYAEIGRALGISEVAARKRVQVARARLRRFAQVRGLLPGNQS